MDNLQPPVEAASPNDPTSAKLKAPWQAKLAGFSLGASIVGIIAEVVGVAGGRAFMMLLPLSLLLLLLSILTGLISILARGGKKGVIGKASLAICLSIAFLVFVMLPALKVAGDRARGTQQQQPTR